MPYPCSLEPLLLALPTFTHQNITSVSHSLWVFWGTGAHLNQATLKAPVADNDVTFYSLWEAHIEVGVFMSIPRKGNIGIYGITHGQDTGACLSHVDPWAEHHGRPVQAPFDTASWWVLPQNHVEWLVSLDKEGSKKSCTKVLIWRGLDNSLTLTWHFLVYSRISTSLSRFLVPPLETEAQKLGRLTSHN